MARKILQETTYTFNPATRTIVIPHYIPQERLVLITNVTSNTIIYNFSDSTLVATSYSASGGQTFPQVTTAQLASGLTTIVLNYNTASMSSADKIQILIDEYEDRFIPHETMIDPANKLRVSTPQSLIDTDFELGLQTTKWEFFQAQNGAQSVYFRPTDNPLQPIYAGQGFSIASPTFTYSNPTITLSGLTLPSAPPVGSYVYIIDNATSPLGFTATRYPIATSSTSAITIAYGAGFTAGTAQLIVFGALAGTAANPSYAVISVSNNISSFLTAGLPVSVNETFDELGGDGTYTIAYTTPSYNSFAFLPKSPTTNYNILNKPGTVCYLGGYYGAGYGAGSNIMLSAAVVAADTRTVTLTTVTPHGLTVGAPIFVYSSTQTNANGPMYVLQVPSATTLTYSTLNAATAGSIFQNSMTLNLRPEGILAHRPGDGGVQIASGNNAIGNQVVRQTRRYFRYQSGKGMQFSTAFTFKPNYDIVSVAVSGQIATITIDADHGLKPGATVRFTGLTATSVVDKNIYNNTFVVLASQPITLRTFSVQLSATPSDLNPGGLVPTVEVVEAKGYTARAGMFDDQNGMYWEYDGASLNVVRRNSTSILRGGLINVLTGSSLVIGDPKSRFTRQLVAGDKIVIRGQTYQVATVISDTQMFISPAYRAATPSSAQGTSGLPYSTLVAATGTTQTINIQTTTPTTLTQTFTAVAGTTATTGGRVGDYYFQYTTAATATPTYSSGGGTGLKTMIVTSVSSILPGMLIVGTNIPSNTYVDTSWNGSTTITMTQAATGTPSGTMSFYLVPSPGATVTVNGGAAGSIPSNTSVSSTSYYNSTTMYVYINQAIPVAITAGTYDFGKVVANTAVSVINLSTTVGVAPGMVITGVGIPSNCIVAYVQNQGSGIVLNQPITLTSTLASGLALSFTTQHSMYAYTLVTGASATSLGSSTITLTSITGVQVGSYLTAGTAGQYFPVGTYVISINGLIVTLNQVTTASIPGGTSIVFASRINVVNSSQAVVNGTWPILAITNSTITFQTALAATSGTVSTYGTTKIFGEDQVVRKFVIKELRIPQTQFNLDRLDGTGPSGFNIDLTKVQMIFMDYTWYGAGFVRWGVRTTNGDILYAHKLQHGNTQYQAYLRSGNLPGRFELTNLGSNPQITAAITSTGYTVASPGTISVYDATRYFVPFTGPSGEGKNGEVLVDGEYFFYTGLASTTGVAPWAQGDNGLTSVATLGTPVVGAGSLLSIPVLSGGAGYTTAPPITISGPGAGARAIANVINGSVVSITVTMPGSGFTSAPLVYIGANQITGVVREASAVAVGATASTTVALNSTAITNVTNAASYYVGMKFTCNTAYFNNIPVTITGISGTTVYVDIAAAGGSGATTITPIQKGTAATVHNTVNNTSLPVSTALCTVQQVSPAAQHWGVSVMMDGRFDNDKSYVFTTPKQTAATIQANQTAPVMSIRVSPSVSLGFARNFGVRDIVNRMQLNLYQMDVYTSGQFLVTIRYNCASTVFQPALWTANLVGSGSLAQVIYHNPQDIVTGGDVVTAFYATNAGTGIFSTTQQDLTIVKDLGNSVIGGDSVYPDGPDVITVFATNLSTSASSPIFARLSWNEAQA